MRLTTNFPAEIMEARRYWNGISEMLKGKKKSVNQDFYIQQSQLPLLTCGLYIMTYFRRVQYGIGEKSNFLMKTNITSAR